MTTIGLYDTKYFAGSQKITQRTSPCLCGCQGRDSWHAATLKRVVKNFVLCSEPRHNANTDTFTIAFGTYAHPEGERRCELRLVAYFKLVEDAEGKVDLDATGCQLHRREDGSVVVLGWYRVGA